MKKLIIILAASLSINAVSAQSRNAVYNSRDHNQYAQTINNPYDNGRGGQAYYSSQRNDQYNRQVAYDRTNGQYDQRNNGYGYDRTNGQYDQRNNGYGYDHSVNTYDRQRRINYDERESRQNKSSLGTGLVVGGIAAVLLGALISR